MWGAWISGEEDIGILCWLLACTIWTDWKYNPLKKDSCQKEKIMKYSLVAQTIKCLPAMPETWVRSLGQEKSPGERNGNPLQDSCLGNPMDRGTWWAAVHGITKSRTRLRDFTFTFKGSFDNPPITPNLLLVSKVRAVFWRTVCSLTRVDLSFSYQHNLWTTCMALQFAYRNLQNVPSTQ